MTLRTALLLLLELLQDDQSLSYGAARDFLLGHGVQRIRVANWLAWGITAGHLTFDTTTYRLSRGPVTLEAL